MSPHYLRLLTQKHSIIHTVSVNPDTMEALSFPVLLWLEMCLQTGCSSVCSRYHFFCDDGCCVDITLACDGVEQCPDGSDEAFCQNRESPASHFGGRRDVCILTVNAHSAVFFFCWFQCNFMWTSYALNSMDIYCKSLMQITNVKFLYYLTF